MHCFSSLLWLLLFFSTTDAYFGYGLIRCQFNSTRDVTYLEQLIINKLYLAEFNSAVGKYVGFTDKAEKIAEEINKSKGFLAQAKKNQERCQNNSNIIFDVLSKPVEPTITLRRVKAGSRRDPSIFVCSAYNFYPKHIKLTWLKNGKTVTAEVTSTDEVPSGNWLHQIHSQLEVVSTTADTISCMVEHASLMQPKVYDWELLSPSDRNKIAVGTAGMLLGLVFITCGLLLYRKRKNSHAHHRVPTS